MGARGQIVEVQAHIASGLPRTTIVGLADTAVSEARDRVRSAVVNSAFLWPDQRITVGLSPASQHKHGSGLDFAIAIAVLAADGKVAAIKLSQTAFVGELGLDGSVRPVSGAVAMASALRARRPNIRVFVSRNECQRWALVPGIEPVAVGTLAEAVSILRGQQQPGEIMAEQTVAEPPDSQDLSEVRGQGLGAFALEVAATGGHHILLTGAPGVGKTMLAKRLPGLLPSLTIDQRLEVAAIHEADSEEVVPLSVRPPVQAPHHTASHVSLVGGATGHRIRPGLVSLAHNGVLLLDEAPEFRRATLEALRQPLEEGTISVARAGSRAVLPARFLLAMTANPCPCGEYLTPGGDCRCTSLVKRRYSERLSGPLKDRLDIRLHIGRPLGSVSADRSADVRARVVAARDRLARRLIQSDPAGHVQDGSGSIGHCVSDVPADVIRRDWPWSSRVEEFLSRESGRHTHNGRSSDKVVRLTWTIADLAEHDQPDVEDAAMALRLRDEVA